MVRSVLSDKVNYPETRALDDADRNLDAALYEVTVAGEERIIALGNPKFTFITENIVYYPVYIIENDRVRDQIGVYEIMSSRQPEILDEDGDIDVERLGPLLLYSYVEEQLSKKPEEKVDVQDPTDEVNEEEKQEKEEAEDEEAEDEEGDEGQDMGMSPLKAQGADQASVERNAYKKQPNEDWIATYIHNNNFGIQDNEGGGDCLFAAIRDGLAKDGITVTVEELRGKLAEEATDDVYQGYKQMYIMAQGELAAATADAKRLQGEVRELKKRAANIRDREILDGIARRAKELGAEHKIAINDKRQAKLLIEEYEFMKSVDSLEQFKARVKTCNFWGETWAVSTLERIMNIKLVLFSEEAYKQKDFDNVLLCGQLNDTILQERGEFTPSHYIMLEFIGWHYRLITYKSRGAFSFDTLPYDVKAKVVDRCMERAAGPFYIIPDFRAMLESLKLEAPDPNEPQEVPEIGLFDDSTVFQFYYKSADKPPGKGSGEQIAGSDRPKYNKLAAMQNWRKKLSNFHVEPFDLDGHKWSSVEHYYQASKFKENSPDFYLSFSLDMNPEGELSKDPAMAKGAGGKSGKYKGKLIRPKEVKIDPNFFSGRDKQEMKIAQGAKFSQSPELNDLLLATNDAKLTHFARGSDPVVFTELMEVRRELKRK